MRNGPLQFREVAAVALFAGIVGICHRAAEYTADHVSVGVRAPASNGFTDESDSAGRVVGLAGHMKEETPELLASVGSVGLLPLAAKREADESVPVIQRITEFAPDASACKHTKAQLESDLKLHYRCLRSKMNETRSKLFKFAAAQAKKNPARYGSLKNLESLATSRCKAGRGFSAQEISRIEELVEKAIPNEPQRPDLGVAISRKVTSHGKTSLKPYMYWGERDFFALVTTAMGEARNITYNHKVMQEPMVLSQMMMVMKAMKNNMAAEKFPRDMFGLATHGKLYQPWFSGNHVTACMIAGRSENGSTLDFDRAVYAYAHFIHPKTKFKGVTNRMFYFARNGRPFSSAKISKTPVTGAVVEFPDGKTKVKINSFRGGDKHYFWDNLTVPKSNSNF